MTQPCYIAMICSIKWIRKRYRSLDTTRPNLRIIKHLTSTSNFPLFKNSCQNNKTLKLLLSRKKNKPINERPIQLGDKINSRKNVQNAIKQENNSLPHSKRRLGSRGRELLSLKFISRRMMISRIFSTIKTIAQIMTFTPIINTELYLQNSLEHH